LDIDPLKVGSAVLYFILSAVLILMSLKDKSPNTLPRVAAKLGYLFNIGVGTAVAMNAIYPLPSGSPLEIDLYNLIIPYSFMFVMYIAKLLVWHKLGLLNQRT